MGFEEVGLQPQDWFPVLSKLSQLRKNWVVWEVDLWTCGRWTRRRGWPVRPTLAHESFITHAGKAARVAKAEQKPAECIRPPLWSEILHWDWSGCTKEGLYSVPGGWGSDSYAGFGWGGKAKAALQSVLHMRAGLCSLHIARPPTYCPHIARPLTYFSACRRFSNYFLRNIHRSRASGWLRLRYLSLFWLDGEPAELNLFSSTFEITKS